MRAATPRTASSSASPISRSTIRTSSSTTARLREDHQVNTEELRQAVVHYRGVFADLLQVPEVPRTFHEAHA